MHHVIIKAVNLHKEYPMGDDVVRALDGVDLEVRAGEFLSVTGSSGSGKSTLMHILGCLDRPTSGTLEFRGEQVSSMTPRQLARVRNAHIGFVFQTFNLINRTSALENVLMPLIYKRGHVDRALGMRALEQVGLSRRYKHMPNELSGGERQRVAIARAIVNNPDLILADEPTGNLDTRTGEQIMQIFSDLHAQGKTIIVVTHEMDVAALAERLVVMRDGRIIEDTKIDDARRVDMLAAAQRLKRNQRKTAS